MFVFKVTKGSSRIFKKVGYTLEMTRPIRIKYENAFYHVVNPGRGRQAIFHEVVYYQSFLDILAGACERFDCIVHAYCLMGNHYHLLIETLKANLSRVMPHIKP